MEANRGQSSISRWYWALMLPILLALALAAGSAYVTAASSRPNFVRASKPAGAPLTTPTTPTTLPCAILAGNIIPILNSFNSVSGTLDRVSAVSANDVWGLGSITVGENQYSVAHWDGVQWYPMLRPLHYAGRLVDIAAISPTNAWVVGYRDDYDWFTAVIYHWNGRDWDLSSFQADTRLYGVTATSPNDVWAVGAKQYGTQTMFLHWDGSHWSDGFWPNPPNAFLHRVKAIAANDIWAMGDRPNQPVFHWSGTGWSTLPGPDPGSTDGTLEDVSGVSPNDAWVVGDGHSYHWDGSQWNDVHIPIAPLGVAAISSNDVWAVGFDPAGGSDAFAHWDGTQWNTVSGPNGIFKSVSAISSTDIWAVGFDSAFAHWDGAAWRQIPSDTAFNTLRGLMILSDTDIWAVGSFRADRYDQATFLHWDGTQWNHMTNHIGSTYINGLAALSPTDIWAVGYANYPTQTYASTLLEHWDGSQWELLDPSPNIQGTNNYLTGVAAISSEDIWAVGYYGLPGTEQPLFLHLDGTQWAIVSGPNLGTSSLLTGVTAISADDVWAVGYYKPDGTSPEQTLTLHWDGSQWTQVPGPNVGKSLNELWSVSAASSHDIWAVGYSGAQADGQTLTLHWDGTQWNVVPSPNLEGGGYLFSVKAASSGNVWAVGNYFSPGVGAAQTLVMRWDGTCWSLISSPNSGAESNYLFGVDVVSDNEVWAVGDYRSPGRVLMLVECFELPTFTDVQPTDYFYEAVRYLSCIGAVSGYPDGTFRPYNMTTRAQLSKIVVLARSWAVECPPTGHFSDVSLDHPFYCFIETAYAHGIIAGYLDGTFRPDNGVTRGPLCKIIVQAMGWNVDCPQTSHFADVSRTDPFYCFIETAYAHNVIAGYSDGTFRPGNLATRGQVSKIVYRAMTSEPGTTPEPLDAGQ